MLSRLTTLGQETSIVGFFYSCRRSANHTGRQTSNIGLLPPAINHPQSLNLSKQATLSIDKTAFCSSPTSQKPVETGAGAPRISEQRGFNLEGFWDRGRRQNPARSFIMYANSRLIKCNIIWTPSKLEISKISCGIIVHNAHEKWSCRLLVYGRAYCHWLNSAEAAFLYTILLLLLLLLLTI